MTDTMNSLITIFILAIPGAIFGKMKLISAEQTRGMSSFMMKIILPALIINSMQIEFTDEIFNSSIKIFMIVFIMFLAVLVIGTAVVKLLNIKQTEKGIVVFILFFANTGGIGIPIVSMIFGKEAVFYAGVVEMAVDILIFTAGIILIQWSGSQEGKVNFKMLINPGTIAIVIGYSFFLLGIKLPKAIYLAFDKLGGANLPIAMFIIGYQLGTIRLAEIFGDIKIYIIAFIKMTVIPALFFFASKYIFMLDDILVNVITILMSMPTGTAAVVFAGEYGANVKMAAKSVLITTIIAPLSIVFLTALFA